MNTIGKNLERMMIQRRLTERQLAKMVDVYPSSISQWLKGIREPQAYSIVKLCKALDCSADELLGIERRYCENDTLQMLKHDEKIQQIERILESEPDYIALGKIRDVIYDKC